VASGARAAAVDVTEGSSGRALRVLGTLGLLGLAACSDPERLAQPPDVDRAIFEAEVYPILLRDCGFPACHGDGDRFFRVHGPGRTRLDPSSLPYDPPSTEEIDATFDRARSMLSGVPDPMQSLLLRKPLEAAAGGGAHVGLDALGRNVYASTDDPSWQAIAAWAGATVILADAGITQDARQSDGGDSGSGGDGGRRDAGARDSGETVDAGAEEDAP